MTDTGLSLRVHFGTWSWSLQLKVEHPAPDEEPEPDEPEPEGGPELSTEVLSDTELAEELQPEPQRLGFKK